MKKKNSDLFWTPICESWFDQEDEPSLTETTRDRMKYHLAHFSGKIAPVPGHGQGVKKNVFIKKVIYECLKV